MTIQATRECNQQGFSRVRKCCKRSESLQWRKLTSKKVLQSDRCFICSTAVQIKKRYIFRFSGDYLFTSGCECELLFISPSRAQKYSTYASSNATANSETRYFPKPVGRLTKTSFLSSTIFPISVFLLCFYCAFQ